MSYGLNSGTSVGQTNYTQLNSIWIECIVEIEQPENYQFSTCFEIMNTKSRVIYTEKNILGNVLMLYYLSICIPDWFEDYSSRNLV